MSQSTTLVGPRGWAALTLAGGSVLAVPFLRPSHTEPDATSPVAVAQADGSASPQGGVRKQSLHDVSRSSVLPGRQVQGTLPTTDELAPLNEMSQLTVPDWAQQRSKLEALMARDAAASVPALSIPEVSSSGRPTTSIVGMKPWTSGEGRQASGEPVGRVLRPVLPPPIASGANELADRVSAPGGVPARNVIVRQAAAPSGIQAVTIPATLGQRDAGFPPSRDTRPTFEVLPTPSSVKSGAVLPNATVQNFGEVANPPRKPNFVFQPGMRRE